MTSEATVPVVQFLRDGLDPIAELGRLRAEEPVSRFQIPDGPTVWLVTRYADVRSVLADTERFSNDFANLSEETQPEQDPGGLGFRDPPEHTRLRKLLTPEFTMRRLRRLVPRIETLVEEHLDAMAASGSPVDLVESFALPIPALVVCELLGVPYAERAEFKRRSLDRFDLSGNPLTSLTAVGDSLDYLEHIVREQRAEPGDGLLGRLLSEHGDELTDRELAGLADGVLTGGHDTTTSMLSLGTLLLLRDPEHAALVRDGDEEQVDAAVEELLRFLTVVQVAFPRFARHDLEIAGQAVRKGDMVLCSLSGADRDGELGAEMDAFDPRRTPARHLAFGHGAHLCVGAQLARMEMRIAFPALLRRFPSLRLDVEPHEVAFRPFSIVYGTQSLPVAW